MYRYKVNAPDFLTLDPDAPGHGFLGTHTAQTVLVNDLPHLLLESIMEPPFLHQGPVNGVFRLGVDNVDDDLFRLEEAVNAVDGLNEIIELVVNTDEDSPVTIPLEIAPLAR